MKKSLVTTGIVGALVFGWFILSGGCPDGSGKFVPNTDVVLRSNVHGCTVAVAIFALSDGTTQEVKIPDTENQLLAQEGVDTAYDVFKPTPDSRFLMAIGGIPALDTVDGYAHIGDAYEKDGELIVATSEDIGFEYKFAKATDPINGSSDQTEEIYSTSGTRIILKQYNKSDLPTFQQNGSVIDLIENGVTVASADVQTDYQTTVSQIPNHHSVTFDAKSSGSGYTSGTTLTISHTVAAQYNRQMSVAVGYASGGGQTISGITYNSAAFTMATTTANNNSRTMDLWSLIAPSTGTNTYTVTQTATTNDLVVGAWSVYGASQGVPFSNINSAKGTGVGTGAVTINSAVGELVVSMMDTRTTNITTPDVTWTSDWNAQGSSIRYAGSHIAGASPSVTRTDTFAANAEYIVLGGSIPVAEPSHTKIIINNSQVLIGAPIIVRDSFTSANINPLAGNWTTMPTHDAVQIDTNQVEGTVVGGNDDGVYWNANPFPADQYAQITVKTLNSTTARNATVAVRQSATANTRYLFRVRGPLGAGTVAWQTTRVVAGTTTTLSSGTTTLNSGDKIRIQVVGSTIIATINGTVLATDTDTNITSGQPGFEVWSNAGAVTDAQVDDFEAGSLTGGTKVLQ